MRTLIACWILPVVAFAAPDFARIDSLWKKRDDPAVMKQIEAELAAAAKEAPDDYGVLWRQARFKQWIADGLPDGDLKKNLGKECWHIAEQAVSKNGNAVEGHYYAAVCIGNYSQAVGILTALGEGLEGKFNGQLDTAIRIDPNFEDGAPLIAKGRYYYELPWPKRDLGKSAEWYQKAIAAHPVNLRAHMYLAETWLHDGKSKQAKEEIAKAINGTIDYDPPEGARARAQAKSLQAKERDLR